jgi:DNA-binding NarL/FixJ family response regulator
VAHGVIHPVLSGVAMTQVLIIGQFLAFRDAVASRLQTEPDLTVVAKAHSAEFAASVLVGRAVDVILLDADLPDRSAVSFCSEMMRRPVQPCVVMLSATSEPERIVAAVRAGAAAWVRKDESIDHLLGVIRGVVRGETWLPPRELGVVLQLLIEDQDHRSDSDDLLAALTPRERDVLLLLVEGVGRKEVAKRLQLSANTVRTHLHSLMSKLGVHSTLEVVALARPRLEAMPEAREPRRPVLRDAQSVPRSRRSGFAPEPRSPSLSDVVSPAHAGVPFHTAIGDAAIWEQLRRMRAARAR